MFLRSTIALGQINLGSLRLTGPVLLKGLML